MPTMSTKAQQSVRRRNRIAGARIRAQSAREQARETVRQADRAETETWSMRMEGYGGLAQPSPTMRDRM
jgi:hypothetical protein